MASTQTGGVGSEELMAAWGIAGHRSAGGEQFYCVSFTFLGFYSSSFLSFSLLLLLLLLFYIILLYFNY